MTARPIDGPTALARLAPTPVAPTVLPPDAVSPLAPGSAPAQKPAPPPPVAPVVVGPPAVAVARHPVPLTKRAIDVVVAAVALGVLSPLLVLLAVLVRCTSRGPILFRQVRIGHGGEPFVMLKFRSMRDGAHVEVARLRAMNEASGPLFKMRRDPRLTPVGRFMRRLSLDELPQLFNVLGGSMSLVGPRPALPEEVAAFSGPEHGRHAVRPGLTGLAQVTGRSDLPWTELVSLDLHYVEHRSLWLDLAVLARTVPAVLTGRGAY